MFGQNMGASLPTLECGQAILGHYRAGNELVIHARPCLALLPAYMGALAHRRHLRILGALWASLADADHAGRMGRLWLLTCSPSQHHV